MNTRSSFLASLVVLGGLFLLGSTQARATLLESWENTADGWTINTSENAAYSISGFSTSLGVTNGTYSMAVTGTGSPTYGQMLVSPSTLANTAAIANASSVSIDVYTPSASFGFFLQWKLSLDNADTGFVSNINGGNYNAVTIGSQSTITMPITPALNAALAASTNPTTLIWQVGGGFSSFNETFYVDNMQYTADPEPATLSLLGLGACGLIGMAIRRRRS